MVASEEFPLITSQAQDFSEALRAFGVRTGAVDAVDFVDRVEAHLCELAKIQPGDTDVAHTFTPGLYARTYTMAAGSVVVSKIHDTKHQFIIMEGSISVWTRERGVVTYHAPHHGITIPGTRRILFAHLDTKWVTFHPTDETDVDAIENQIIVKHLNPHRVCPGQS